MNNDIYLTVNGKKYLGWKEVNINKSLSQMAGAFGFQVTDRYPNQARKYNFGPGDSCKIGIDDQTIITGYIDAINISYTHDTHTIQITGRDNTADLVDCSFNETSNEWKQQSIQNIVKALCKPYGITVVVDETVQTQANEKINQFKANESDSVSELIIKVCKSKAILPINYGDGFLTLTRAGSKKANDSLQLGKNILSGAIEQDNSDRFSIYTVKGQGVSSDNIFSIENEVTTPKGQATDSTITRYRPITILSETATDAKRCLVRSEWEARNRAGLSRKFDYSVQGWTQSNGAVWTLNSMIKVKDEFLGVNKDLLIASVSFLKSESLGTITEFSIVPRETFELLETPIIQDIATDFDWMSKL